MAGQDSVGRNEPRAAQLQFDHGTHIAHYPHQHAASLGGEVDDDLDGVALRAAAGLLGGLDDEAARERSHPATKPIWLRS